MEKSFPYAEGEAASGSAWELLPGEGTTDEPYGNVLLYGILLYSVVP